ncbi:MAG TPA: hypothetical protein VHQ88_06805, partial [Burkholderiales bacterium]|nr:hypothetical protein [Burkholderiales bacterium]
MTFSPLIVAAIFDGLQEFWQILSRVAKAKRKGLQLALEPLNGQGIAGYVPEPELWMRPRGQRLRCPRADRIPGEL